MANTAWSIRVGVDLDTSGIQQQLNNATQGAKIHLDTSSAEGSLDNLNSKFDVTYQMANKIYQMSKEAIGAMVEQVYTIDKALTEFKKVSDLRGSGLDEYVKELGESGQIVARTTSDMIDAATMFKKSGFTESEAKDLAVMATMFQNISDVSVTAGDAAASIVSQLQAFGRGNLEAIHILDAYNKVAADFAVGTNDLSSAMEIAAAGMATYGNSFEQTIGLITAGTEIMQGRSSQVARGLNTIAANIVKQKDLLAEYGIEVADSNGNLKSTYDVLRELKPQWDKMTDSERNALGVTLAGKNQYRVLASIMTNFAHAVGATNDALNSSGTALQQNAAYMESLEAKTTRVKALFQDFSQGVVDSDIVKGVLDLAAGLLKIGNTDLGHVITQFTLLSGVLTGIAGMAIKGLGLPVALTTVLPYIAGVVAAFVGLYNIIKLVEDKLQEQADAKVFDNVKNKIDESKQKIDDYNNKIKESSDRLQELNKVPFEERTDEINAEISRLEALITAYQTLAEQERQKLATEGLESLRKTQFESGVTVTPDTYGSGAISEKYLAQQPIVDALSKSYNTYEEAVYGVSKAVASVDESFAKFIAEGHSTDEIAQQLDKRFIDIEKTFRSWDEQLYQSSYDMRGYILDLNGATEPSQELLKSTEDLISKNKDYYDTLKTVKDAGGQLNQQEEDFIKTYDLLSTQYEKAKVGAENFAKAQKAISEAQEEWKNQRYDATLQDYVDALTNIEGIDISNVGSMLDILKQTGAISLDYTQEELQQVLDKVGEVDGAKAEVEVDANTEAVFDEILSAEEQLEAQGITITSSSDADALLNSMELIQQKIQELSSESIKISVTSDMSKALSEANNVTKAVNGIPRSKSVSVNIGVNGLSAVQSAASSIAGVYSKTATVTINVLIRNAKTGQLMDSIPHYATGVGYFAGGKALVNDGAPVNGSSAELVVADGKANIYNNGEPTVVNLPRGAKIYTAAETQEILKNSNTIDNLQAPSFADGNVKIPSEINAQTIVYDTSDYYKQNVKQIDKTKDAFDAWQKEKKHFLELDLITQEQYYLDLEYMNENYLKDISGQQDEYWRYQEEIYKWKKSQLVDENELLERQIELEKALQDVAKAKMQKILVYKDGKFQYMADIDAIAEAQRNVSELKAKGYASGTSNATPGLHLVGENGPELRVLNGGDGIIPADATKNLLQIAKMSTEGLSNAFNKTMQNIYNFAIDNLSLPDIKNANEFLDGLKNYAYQYSYANS